MNTPPTPYEIERLRQDIAGNIQRLEFFISVTPTSEQRNRLTEANINLYEARKQLERAKAGL